MTRLVEDVLAVFTDDDIEVEDAGLACLILSNLLVGKSIPQDLWTEEKRAELAYRWVPVMPRSVNPGDVVRVKEDAYAPTSKMARHNGMTGTVVALRRGVVVSYTGFAGGSGLGVTHPPAALERRVPVPHLASDRSSR